MSLLNELKLSLENEDILNEDGEVIEVTDADMAEADAEFAQGELVRQQVERDIEQAERAEAVIDELEGTNQAIRAAVDNGTFTREAAAMVEAQRRTAAVALNLDPEEGAGAELVDNPGLESMVFNQGNISLEQNENMIAKVKKVIATIVDKVIAGYEKVKLFFQKLFNYLPSQIKNLKERWSQVKPEDISDELVKELNEKYQSKVSSLLLVSDEKSLNHILAFIKAGQEYVDVAAASGDVAKILNATSKFVNHEFGVKHADGGAALQFGSMMYIYKAVGFEEGEGKASFTYRRQEIPAKNMIKVKDANGLYKAVNNFVNAVDGKYNFIKKMDSINSAIGSKMKKVKANMSDLIGKKMAEKLGDGKEAAVGIESGIKFTTNIYRASLDVEQGLLGTLREIMSVVDKVISKSTDKKEETKEA